MGTDRLPMRQIHEILRLKHERGLGHRVIARACGVGHGAPSRHASRCARGENLLRRVARLLDPAVDGFVMYSEQEEKMAFVRCLSAARACRSKALSLLIA